MNKLYFQEQFKKLNSLLKKFEFCFIVYVNQTNFYKELAPVEFSLDNTFTK